MSQLGTPYRFGGANPRGFDCSGLVQHVFRSHGLSLPRTVADQARVGRPTRRLLPGDLVFFRLSGQGPSHVGIYVGGERFVHASSGRQAVAVDDLATNSYFRARYAGARRVLE